MNDAKLVLDADEVSHLKGIAAQPAAPMLRRIYADWLEERGRLGEACQQREAAEAVEMSIEALTTHTVKVQGILAQVGQLAVTSPDGMGRTTRLAIDGQALDGVRSILLRLPGPGEQWEVEVGLVPGMVGFWEGSREDLAPMHRLIERAAMTRNEMDMGARPQGPK